MKKIIFFLFAFSFALSSFGQRRWIPKIAAAAGGGNDLAFRSGKFSGQATANGYNASTEPTGTAQNDIMIGLALCDIATTITQPTGWTLITSGSGPASTFKYNLSYIRRGASAPSLTWTMGASAYREVYILSYSGATPSGTPYGATSDGGVTTTTTPNGPAVTTTAANSLVLSIIVDWSGSTTGGWTKPTGYTLRTDNTVGNDGAISDKPVATSGTSEDPGAWAGAPNSNSAWTYTLELLD